MGKERENLHYKHMSEVLILRTFLFKQFAPCCISSTFIFSWIMLKMRIIPSGGLFFSFHGLLPPQFAWIAAFIGSVEQCGSTGWHSPGALLFLGVAKRQLLGCSASVKILQFCTCFLDNWHLKGRLWLLTVCPWPTLGFSFKKLFVSTYDCLSFSL